MGWMGGPLARCGSGWWCLLSGWLAGGLSSLFLLLLPFLCPFSFLFGLLGSACANTQIACLLGSIPRANGWMDGRMDGRDPQVMVVVRRFSEASAPTGWAQNLLCFFFPFILQARSGYTLIAA
ncbi:hypothetical protein BC567DRAFT_214088, partial [Phyllosticta citribraziliensis]